MFVLLLFFVICCILCFFFFFQAEDGIRDSSTSRGLGDVYKRQHSRLAILSAGSLTVNAASWHHGTPKEIRGLYQGKRTSQAEGFGYYYTAVSYTHLTLPTKRIV
ncbi:hypothetical protein [Lactobacillus brevis] [Lactiplantibacillus mudanjiangensis]|nr:hypothetical protein [Lactobacillus brevis] [Lactiplantibacillus mudanjiangensis]